MATTTNYGWDTPDDTDLVKDGAAAIRTLGSSIDTTTKNLNPQTTTGALAYRSATANVNTALPIGTAGQILAVSGGVPAWINNDQGDITEVQAGTGISVASGTGPIPIVTNTVATAFDAAGDLVYGTGADTFTKLSLGTAGKVLTVNSGATAPEWATLAAGGWTQIGSTQTLNGATNYTVNTTTGYRNWVIELDDPYGASGDINPYIYFNGDTTNANYRGCVVRSIPAGFQSAVIDTPTVFYFALEPTGANDNYCQIQVFDPDATTHRKGFNCNSVINSSTGTQVSTVMFQWENAAAITSVRVQTDTGVNFAGGTMKVWGLK